MTAMYTAFRRDTMAIINGNSIAPVTLSNECLDVIYDTIDSLINIDETNEDDDDVADASEISFYKQENDMLKLEIASINRKLDLLLGSVGK